MAAHKKQLTIFQFVGAANAIVIAIAVTFSSCRKCKPKATIQATALHSSATLPYPTLPPTYPPTRLPPATCQRKLQTIDFIFTGPRNSSSNNNNIKDENNKRKNVKTGKTETATRRCSCSLLVAGAEGKEGKEEEAWQKQRQKQQRYATLTSGIK